MLFFKFNSLSFFSSLGESGRTPLGLAIWNQNCHLVPILLDSGAKIDIKDIFGRVPLQYASFQSCNPCTKLVISSQTVNLEDKYGRTALHLAAQERFLDGLSLLKDNGATFLSDDEGQTPLHRAAIYSTPETVELLLDLFKDCNLNQEDNKGRTALDYV